ncbi:MAG: glycosyltransferase family 2 protein [Azospira sp.]|jgi:glycosyltransferase involved in cell wall biosynthesis|nr:glycosyltransferase family 2 protein [Azospira sp.]
MNAAHSSGKCLLSIVIPAYNYAGPLERAVGSVIGQMGEDCELIAIDDGSTDETSEVLARVAGAAPPGCRFIRQDNAGPAAARNHGLRLSSGEYVLFLDADDELLPGAVDAIRSAAARHPEVGLILGAHIDRTPDGRETRVEPTPIRGDSVQRLGDYLLRKRISIMHGACVFRRDLVERRPYPEHLRQTEDIPVFAYLVVHAVPLLLDTPLARIYKHPGSLRHDSVRAREAHATLVDEVFSALPDECRVLRSAYETSRIFSVFRICSRASDLEGGLRYYRMALAADWRRALRWKYLGKYLRLRWCSGRHR